MPVPVEWSPLSTAKIPLAWLAASCRRCLSPCDSLLRSLCNQCVCSDHDEVTCGEFILICSSVFNLRPTSLSFRPKRTSGKHPKTPVFLWGSSHPHMCSTFVPSWQSGSKWNHLSVIRNDSIPRYVGSSVYLLSGTYCQTTSAKIPWRSVLAFLRLIFPYLTNGRVNPVQHIFCGGCEDPE
jgi:hypothetical protein